MRFLLLILLLFLGISGLEAQPAAWEAGSTETLAPAGNEINNLLDVKVYPNPIYDKRVNIELSDQAIQELRITNIAGTVIFQKKFQVPVTKHQIVFDNIASGIYLLRVTAANNMTKTSKLMVRNQ